MASALSVPRRLTALRAGGRLRDAAWAVLASRAVVWGVGVPAMVALGYSGWRARADPTNVTATLGDAGEVLGSPAMRWDSIYYVQIAQHGYTSAKQAGFFPLYPLLVGGVDRVLGASPVLVGVLISLVAFLGGLFLLGRLAELEAGPSASRITIWLVALFPASLFFSAVYSEGLFLLLSVGSFLAARRGSWLWAGVLGALAAATRNVGVTLLVPLVLLYLYGPREDRSPDRAANALRPRYRLRADAWWLALVPLGCAIVAYAMWRTFNDPFTAWTSQESYFGRRFDGPFSALGLGAWTALKTTWTAVGAGGHGLGSAAQKTGLFVFAAAAVGIAVRSFWTLPAAYGAYAIASLAPSLSTPRDIGPLNGSIRYVAVAFPLFVWLAIALQDRRRLRLATYAGFTLGLAYCSARFATWRWVA
ncbi:MAG TPA: mannosyltransferase family protein [Solirubrobacteraceae bacterium]|nr:mannosyltransferase family protein [Solirubrobacteraceae bacterium]